MNSKETFQGKTVARGFLIYRGSDSISRQFSEGEFSSRISHWRKTFFGPFQVWVDPLLNYETARDNTFGVSVMGLCINPFDGSSDNAAIARNLYTALSKGENDFFDYLDQLSGSFVVFYRLNDKVRILQDCAATKPVYYVNRAGSGVIASSHSALLGQTLGMERDPRCDHVFQNESYKSDPSRYLPGDVTPFVGMRNLTANTALVMESGTARRFFPRSPLVPHEVNASLIDEISTIFSSQASILAKTNRPLFVAATAGRDSRVSIAAFSRHKGTQLFSFHYPANGHLTEDVKTAKVLAGIVKKKLNVYDLSSYKSPDFDVAFRMTSPVGVWPAAALCYITEFPSNAIHIRSTISEIGRMFYGKRVSRRVSAEVLARAYTVTDFWSSDLVIGAMHGFIEQSSFDEKLFFNYDLYDMFYWEHRNSKWQNILCQEAEMASDVFIPFNNRRLIQLLLSVPPSARAAALLHVEVTNKLVPKFKAVPYSS